MRKQRARLIVMLIVLSLAATVGLPAVAASRPLRQYAQVTILVSWDSSAERDDFQTLLLPFFQAYNIQPNVISTSDLEESLLQQTEPPDMMLLDDPSLMRQFAEADDLDLIDIDTVLGPLPPGYPAALTDILTVDDTVYGRFVRLTAKGLVWFNAPAMDRAGYAVPGSWEAMLDLAQRIQQDSSAAPWAFGANLPDAAVDIMEAYLFQQNGPDLINGLASGEIPWGNAQVREAWEQFGALYDSGVVPSPNRLGVIEAVQMLFADPVNAYLSVGPSTALRWITANSRIKPGQDMDFFLLPAAGNAGHTLVGGDFVVLLNDDPITVQLAEYLTSPDFTTAWARTGSAISLYADAAYPNDVLRAAAALTQPGDPVFDLSDRLHPDVRAVLYDSVWRYITDRNALNDILVELDAAVEEVS
ncbi:MAG: carbohydrate ABC transporter substrate-binding protein [Anaerolineae bacterium]|nr:carbohydrate ABC transporter substrate-binding protein [Anaerolineae bacterium]